MRLSTLVSLRALILLASASIKWSLFILPRDVVDTLPLDVVETLPRDEGDIVDTLPLDDRENDGLGCTCFCSFVISTLYKRKYF